MFSISMYFSSLFLLSFRVIIFTFSIWSCIGQLIFYYIRQEEFYFFNYSIMGTYFCTEPAPPREEIKSRHVNQMFKSANISAKQNGNNKVYFPCQYLGKGVTGCTIQVFLKDKKQQRYAQKITKLSWIQKNFLFLNAALFRQFNYSPTFVHTFSLKVQNKKMYIINEKLELGNIYSSMKRYPKEIQYTALKELTIRLVLIFERLHARDVIYRSLRPENILFTDREGEFQLGELAFCVVGEGTEGYVGAATYTPPEVFAEDGEGFDKAIDFWMLGVMLYELIVGETPFQAPNLAQIKDNIINFHNESLSFPQEMHICEDLSDFIKNLLQPNQHMRMGIDQIKRHKFFHGQSLDQTRDDKLFLRIRNQFTKKDMIPANRIVYSKVDKERVFQCSFTEIVFDQKCVFNSL